MLQTWCYFRGWDVWRLFTVLNVSVACVSSFALVMFTHTFPTTCFKYLCMQSSWLKQTVASSPSRSLFVALVFRCSACLAGFGTRNTLSQHSRRNPDAACCPPCRPKKLHWWSRLPTSDLWSGVLAATKTCPRRWHRSTFTKHTLLRKTW